MIVARANPRTQRGEWRRRKGSTASRRSRQCGRASAARQGWRQETTRRSNRTGAALLEVMIALVILASAGLAATALAREAAHAVEHARAADRALARANAFMEAVALWPREDLDLRLGERAQGPWRLRIVHAIPTLYQVVLIDGESGREIIRTVLYRPERDGAGE